MPPWSWCWSPTSRKSRPVEERPARTPIVRRALTRRFEAQHIVHALNTAGVRRWVALSEGAGGSIGWLTVCQGRV